MTLTLEVVSSNGQSLGAARRKVFGPEGGRIGRAAECEWVIANPYISRHHATVRCADGAYYIESTGENRVAVNSPQACIPPFKPWELQAGDRLYLDEYEIAVTLDVAHFAPMPPVRSSPVMGPPDSFDDLEPARDSAPIPAFEPADEDVDPLRRLSGRSRTVPLEPPPEAKPSWNHTPGLNDHYAPPPVPPPPSYESGIPEDWDKPSFGRSKVVLEPPPAVPSERSSAAATGEIPENWAETNFDRGKGRAAPARAPIAPPPRPQIRESAIPEEAPFPPAGRVGLPPPPEARPQPGLRGAQTAANDWADRALPPRPPVQPVVPPDRGVRAPPPGPRVPPPPPLAPLDSRGAAPSLRVPPRPVNPAPPPPESPDPPAAGFDVDAFFRAAGLDPATVPPETAALLGQIVRTIVQGVVEVLHARAEVKDQFRLAATRVMQRENNPLKFSVNAESAMSFLLGRRDPAYLGPVEAFEDAMNDIRFHQLAMLTGMRAGFDHMMKHFDPSQLQQLFDKRAKRGGLLAMGAKSRYWEHYTEEFSELLADPEAAFRRVFGEAFASGYEKQLTTLKTSHGKPQR